MSETHPGHHHGLLRRSIHGAGGLVAKNGRRASITTSLVTTGLAYLFFVHLRGWTPPPNEQVLYVHLFDIFVSIILAIQMVTVAFTSTSGGRIEIGADLITTFFPAIFMLIVVIRNWTGDAPLSVDQVWDAWFAFGMMWLDVVVDIGVILLAQTRIAISGGRNP